MIQTATSALVGTAALLVAVTLSTMHPTETALLLGLTGLATYGFASLENRNLLNLQGIFSAVWLCSIGLACLRLNPYQFPWSSTMWACVILGYVMFQAGMLLREFLPTRPYIDRTGKAVSIGNLQIYRRKIGEKPYFIWLCVFFAGLMVCLILEILVCGFVPILSTEMDAYVNFQVFPIHYFTVSTPLFFPLSYHYLRKFQIKGTKKILLILMNIVCLLVPVIIVSRQLYLLSVVIDMFVVANDRKKKQIGIIVLAMVLFVTGWFVIGKFRNQSDEYVEDVFTEVEYADESYLQEQEDGVGEYVSNKNVDMPQSLFPAYMYIAFNFDNFNYLIDQLDAFSYGKQTLLPLITYTHLRSRVMNSYDLCSYQLMQTYNTYPFICDYYRDFGVIGVAILSLLTGLLSAAVVKRKHGEDIVWETLAALIKYAVLFCFFRNFFLNVTLWFYVFVLVFIWMIMNVSVRKNPQKAVPSALS